MNPNVFFNARIVNNVSSCISPRISDQRFAMHSDSLHTDNNWNNWFHFQYDRLWPVNMTGKTKSWLVNSPISPDIVRWPAVISSPDRCVIIIFSAIRLFTKFELKEQMNATGVMLDLDCRLIQCATLQTNVADHSVMQLWWRLPEEYPTVKTF